MTDRELLEAAAKAAGLEYTTTEDHDRLMVRGADMLRRPWNPLADDGDALRLATKLYLWEAIRLAHREVSADLDIYAATRRAIVRAAAAMKPAPKETK